MFLCIGSQKFHVFRILLLQICSLITIEQGILASTLKILQKIGAMQGNAQLLFFLV